MCWTHILLKTVKTSEKSYVPLDMYLCCRVLFSMEVSFFLQKILIRFFLYMIQD